MQNPVFWSRILPQILTAKRFSAEGTWAGNMEKNPLAAPLLILWLHLDCKSRGYRRRSQSGVMMRKEEDAVRHSRFYLGDVWRKCKLCRETYFYVWLFLIKQVWAASWTWNKVPSHCMLRRETAPTSPAASLPAVFMPYTGTDGKLQKSPRPCL